MQYNLLVQFFLKQKTHISKRSSRYLFRAGNTQERTGSVEFCNFI